MAARLEYSAQISLDGFIEDATGGIEWTEPSDELHRFWNSYAADVEGFVMGRGLYEAMVPFWPEVAVRPTGEEVMDEFAEVWMSSQPTSSTSDPSARPARRSSSAAWARSRG